MKLKSFKLKQEIIEKGKFKPVNYVDLYESAGETSIELERNVKTSNKTKNLSDETEIRKPKNKKKNNAVENSSSNADIKNSDVKISLDTDALKTTPKTKKASDVKPIIKNTSTGTPINFSNKQISNNKPKKRSKSVSFMLNDNEQVAAKKMKSDNAIGTKQDKSDKQIANNKHGKKKFTKSKLAEKENNNNTIKNMKINENEIHNENKMITKKNKNLQSRYNNTEETHSNSHDSKTETKKKKNKMSKHRQDDVTEHTLSVNNKTESEDEIQTEVQMIEKKIQKRKKRKAKSVQDADPTEGEPMKKSFKKDIKPDVIVDDLENLKIGDNAHTLTNLLDEMTVVDKNKRKKMKRKAKVSNPKTLSMIKGNTKHLQNIDEKKEKIKWNKRKWNKDKKGNNSEDNISNSVIVENLPINIMLRSKQILTEYFAKCGQIKKIGIAEVYPTSDPKLVFTTTIHFESEDAVTKALEEDNSLFEGNYIRVKRNLPPTETTLVVRSYGELTDQALSSVFISAGRIRSIRQLIKGKRAMATAFVEFDGPEAIQQALKIDAKIGGKKIYTARFEIKKVEGNFVQNKGVDEESSDSRFD